MFGVFSTSAGRLLWVDGRLGHAERRPPLGNLLDQEFEKAHFFSYSPERGKKTKKEISGLLILFYFFIF
jgi:hypothetical protein